MRKTTRIWWFILLAIVKNKPALSWINGKDWGKVRKKIFDGWWFYARLSIRQD